MNEITPIWPSDPTELISQETADEVLTTFATADIRAGLGFSMDEARVDGRYVTEYESYVTGRYRRDGDLILVLASGHTYNLSDYLRRLQTGDF